MAGDVPGKGGIEETNGGDLGYVGASHPELLAVGFEKHGSIIDSKLGSNPTGFPRELSIAFCTHMQSEGVTPDDMGQAIIKAGEKYSDDVFGKEPKKTLIDYYGFTMSESAIEFHPNGSYGAGDEIVRLISMLELANRVIATPQSFPNVAQYCARHSIGYEVLRNGTLSPLDSIRRLINSGDDLSGAILYLDTPNNPYGQVDMQLTADAIDYAARFGARTFVDLAYADVLGAESMRQLVEHTISKGGFAVGSLSKTFGLAGHRIGWTVMPNDIAENHYNGSQRLVFGINSVSSTLLQLLMSKDTEGGSIAQRHTEMVINNNVIINTAMYAELSDLGITVHPTDLRVPIQVISDGRDDFFQRIMREGVELESLEDYNGTIPKGMEAYALGNSAVRLLTPPSPEAMSALVYRLACATKK